MTEYKVGDHVKLTENGKEWASNVHSGRDSVYKITKLKGSIKLKLMEVGEPHRTITDIKESYVYPADDCDDWFAKGDHVVLTEEGEKFAANKFYNDWSGVLEVIENDLTALPYKVKKVNNTDRFAWFPKDGIKAAFQFKQGDTVVLTGKGQVISGNLADLAVFIPPISVIAVDQDDSRYPYSVIDAKGKRRWVSADAIKAAPAGPKYAVGDRVIINEAGKASDSKYDHPDYSRPLTVVRYDHDVPFPYYVADDEGVEQPYKEEHLDPAPRQVLSIDIPAHTVDVSEPQLDLETVKFILGNLLQAITETSTAEKAVDTMEGYLQGLITGLEGKCSNETAGEIYANSRQ